MISEDRFDAVRQFLFLEDDSARHQASSAELLPRTSRCGARRTRTAGSRGLLPALFSETFCTARRQSWRDAAVVQKTSQSKKRGCKGKRKTHAVSLFQRAMHHVLRVQDEEVEDE